jgi:hypothetical protein
LVFHAWYVKALVNLEGLLKLSLALTIKVLSKAKSDADIRRENTGIRKDYYDSNSQIILY